MFQPPLSQFSAQTPTLLSLTERRHVKLLFCSAPVSSPSRVFIQTNSSWQQTYPTHSGAHPRPLCWASGGRWSWSPQTADSCGFLLLQRVLCYRVCVCGAVTAEHQQHKSLKHKKIQIFHKHLLFSVIRKRNSTAVCAVWVPFGSVCCLFSAGRRHFQSASNPLVLFSFVSAQVKETDRKPEEV